MSSHSKDPLEKQDTPSDTSGSRSDSEVDETSTKETTETDSNLSKPLESPSQKSTLTCSYDPATEPIAGPSGLEDSRLVSSDPGLTISSFRDARQEKEAKGIDENIGTKMVDVESQTSEKDVEATGVHENVGTRMEEGDSDATSSYMSYQKSTLTCSYGPYTEPIPEPSGLEDSRLVSSDPGPTISSFSDSQQEKKAKGIDENIGTKMVDVEPQTSEKDVEATGVHENVGTRMEEGDSDTTSSTTTFIQSSTGVTPLSQQNPDRLLRMMDMINLCPKVDHYKNPLSCPSSSSKRTQYSTDSANTSADISDIQSEVADSPAEGSVYRDGSESEKESIADAVLEGRRRSVASNTNESEFQDFVPHRTPISSSVSTSSSSRETTSVSVERESILGDERMQVCDSLTEQKRENKDEINPPVEEKGRTSARRIKGGKYVQVCDVGEGSPAKRRRSVKGLSDSSTEEKAYSLRPRSRPDTGKKSKMTTSKSCPALQLSSESPEPKSSCSDELQRKDSPDIESLSDAHKTSKSEKVRKPWQKPGRLRELQHPTIYSEDSVTAGEEEDQTSPLKKQNPPLETSDLSSEKMETSPEKGGEGDTEIAEPSEAKPSTESSDQVFASEAEGTSKDLEQSAEDLKFERSVGKSKRNPKLSSSPTSDEKPDGSPPKASTSRPKKKAKSEKMPQETRRTRHDVEGIARKSVSLDDLQQKDSTKSDSSEDEGETRC